MEIFTRRFKENSHQPIERIKEQQAKHKRDLIQPREGGEVNPEFVQEYGAKHINVSSHDVNEMSKKSHRLANVLDEKRRQQYEQGKVF